MLSEINSDLLMVESDLESASADNQNLVKHTQMPEIRKHIFKDIVRKGYPKIAETVFRPSNYFKLRVFYKFIDIIGWKNYKRLRKIF